MSTSRRMLLSGAVATLLAAANSSRSLAQTTVLPSWNDGPSKQAIVKFVTSAVARGGPGYIAPADRIAVFDNDGTLWAEQPMYFQGVFAFDRVKALAPQHPEWKTTQPFRTALDGDMKALAESGSKSIAEIMMATHAKMTTEQFAQIVSDWIRAARHPRFKTAYTDLTYLPIMELLAYLRANGFKTFIVSGGD